MVHVDTGQFHCLVCDEKGNATTFLRKLHAQSLGSRVGIAMLAENRGVTEDTLRTWGVAAHEITGDYCLPGYDAQGKLMQLYRYGDDKIVKATTGMGHQLFGVPLFDPKKKIVVVCEGPWDAMKLWEELGKYKRSSDGEITRTGSEAASLRSEINVLGIPGCGSVGEPFSKWCSLFDGKRVLLAFDNDHFREKDGRTIEGAGLSATKRACQLILTSGVTVESLEYLKWGDKGWTPKRKSGYDVRDLLTETPGAKGIAEIFALASEVPAEWYSGVKKKTRGGSPEIELLPCSDWKTLITAWRKAMRWGEGLDKGLSTMLASVVSTKALGDQLWVMVMGPPSCGKSTLCEALAVNKKYILSKSTLRGFHSGYDDGSGENHSPLKAMQDKTLVIKDGDTLLQSPNLSQILSEARDVYDRVSRSSYRTKQSKDWEGLNITIILCGTSSLRQLDTSELGERFLKCVIMDEIDIETEREIMLRVIHRAKMSLAFESNGQQESQHEPSMLKAMRLTGGYIDYLRTNARELFASVTSDDAVNYRLLDLAAFVAYMRARPSKIQDETTEREFGTRLASQITRLANCLAVVMGKTKIDEEVMQRVKSIAMDTARGQTTLIAGYLDATDRDGAGAHSIGGDLNIEDGKCKNLLKFLRHIKVVQKYKKVSKIGVRTSVKWRLTEHFQSLYRRVAKDD